MFLNDGVLITKMRFFNLNDEGLAKRLVENSKLYDTLMNAIALSKNLVTPEVQALYELAESQLEQALLLATEGEYLVVRIVEDTWALEQHGIDSGYHLFKRVGSEAVYISLCDHPWSILEILSLLRRNGIKRVCSIEIPSEGILGLEKKSTDPDDNHIIVLTVLDPEATSYLTEAGIQVDTYSKQDLKE